MNRGDYEMIGISAGDRTFRVAASATRAFSGEPVVFAGTLTAGVASVNTVVVATDAKPVIGTDNFVGLFHGDMKVNSAGTVIAQKIGVSVPIPELTLIRGKAKTVANVDTDSELLGVLWDVVLIDLTGTAYTIDETAAANTSGLQIRDGNILKQTLDVVVDVRAMRATIS